jgi:hypothetical protein
VSAQSDARRQLDPAPFRGREGSQADWGELGERGACSAVRVSASDEPRIFCSVQRAAGRHGRREPLIYD